MERCTNVFAITIGELVEKVDNGSICLNLFADNNDIQRQEVWGADKKSKLIDTLLDVDMEVPTMIFVQKDNYYMVVDGKQRLSTIIGFVNDGFRLNSMVSNKSLLGYKFSKLSEELKNRILNKKILFQDIPFKSDAQLRELFVRLNSGEKLKPMEVWRASLGDKLPFLNEMVKHEAFSYFSFTKDQLKHFADVETGLDFILEQLNPGSDHNKKTKEAYAMSCENYDEFSVKFKTNIITKLDYISETLMLGKDYKKEIAGKLKKVTPEIVKSANKILIFRLADEALKIGMTNEDFYSFLENYFTNTENSYSKIAGTTSTSNKVSLVTRYSHLLKEFKKYSKKVA